MADEGDKAVVEEEEGPLTYVRSGAEDQEDELSRWGSRSTKRKTLVRENLVSTYSWSQPCLSIHGFS
jgi:hypothetical protein